MTRIRLHAWALRILERILMFTIRTILRFVRWYYERIRQMLERKGVPGTDRPAFDKAVREQIAKGGSDK